MANCNGTIAMSIALECSHPIEGGYTGRAILIPWKLNPTITPNSTNPRIIEDIQIGENDKVVAVENYGATPFSGSAKTGNTDAGRNRFVKPAAILIPLRGADTAKDLVEPLINDPQGFMMISEKKDKRGLGSYEIKGYQSPMKADPTTYSRDEDANGGAASLTLTCTEDWEEVDFFDTDYATTKAAFETLLASAY